jgi:hypothetical protein
MVLGSDFLGVCVCVSVSVSMRNVSNVSNMSSVIVSVTTWRGNVSET